MSEALNYSPESQETQFEQQLSEIEAHFGDFGFEDFENILSQQDTEKQEIVFSIFSQYSQDANFGYYIDFEGLPYSVASLEELIINFPVQEEAGTTLDQSIILDEYQEDGVFQIEEEEGKEEDVQDIASVMGNTEIQSELAEVNENALEAREAVMGELIDFLSTHFENVYIPADFQGAKQYIEANYERLLQQASEESEELFVQTYERFRDLDSISISLDLSSFTPDYLRLNPPENVVVGPEREEAILTALGTSGIADVDGDTIRGNNGEIIELSGSSVNLSLQGADGLILEVGEVQRLDTRADEVALEGLETERDNNNLEIQNNTSRIADLEVKLTNFNSEPGEFYDNEAVQDEIATQFAALTPRTGIVDRIEQGITGGELKAIVVEYFQSKIDGFTERNAELEDRNKIIGENIGVISSRIQKQRLDAAKELEKSKERVRQSQHLFESMGISRVIATMMEIFPMISERKAVTLPSRNLISEINISTLEMEGSFTPPLGESGATDLPTQNVIAELMGVILSDNSSEIKIDFGATGDPIFMISGEIVDKMKFDSHVSTVVGDLGFKTKVLQNLGFA